MDTALLFLGSLAGSFGGVTLGAFLYRRNTRAADSERLLCEALNDAIAAIADVAALNVHRRSRIDPALRPDPKAMAEAQARYSSAMSRVALHGSQEVVQAFAEFNRHADTSSDIGRSRFMAATNIARKSMGLDEVGETDLLTLHFGADQSHHQGR